MHYMHYMALQDQAFYYMLTRFTCNYMLFHAFTRIYKHLQALHAKLVDTPISKSDTPISNVTSMNIQPFLTERQSTSAARICKFIRVTLAAAGPGWIGPEPPGRSVRRHLLHCVAPLFKFSNYMMNCSKTGET